MPLGLGNSLTNDDRLLNVPASNRLTGSPTGLGLTGSPQRNVGLEPPTGIDFEAAAAQLGSLSEQRIAPPPRPAAPPSGMYFSPSTGEMIVNGYQFNQENASRALESTRFAAQPRAFQLPSDISDWRPLSEQEYTSYIDSIQNPGLGRRVSESWENAWRGMADIGAGALLALNDDNEWAQNVRTNIAQAYENNAPFMLGLRDVDSPQRGVEYVAQMLVQGVPWLIETAVSMAAGAVVGGAVSGGVGAPAGAVEGFILKEGLRQAGAQVLRGSLRRGALAYRAARDARRMAPTMRQVVEHAGAAGASTDDVRRFYQFAERAYHMSRGGSIGSQAAMFASNYATGVGDVRNTLADAGVDTSTAEAAAHIWGYAIPYALLESAGDLIITNPVTQFVPGMGRGPTHLGNIARGAALSAGGEGLEEVGQDITLEAARASAQGDQMHLDPMDLLETGVAGAIAGAGVGGVAGLLGGRTRQPVPPPPPMLALPAPDEPLITPPPYTPPPPTQSPGMPGTRMPGGPVTAPMENPEPAYDTPAPPPTAGITPEPLAPGDADTLSALSYAPPAEPPGPTNQESMQNTADERETLFNTLETLLNGPQTPQTRAQIADISERIQVLDDILRGGSTGVSAGLEGEGRTNRAPDAEASARYVDTERPRPVPAAPLAPDAVRPALEEAERAIVEGTQQRTMAETLTVAGQKIIDMNGRAAGLMARMNSAMKNGRAIDARDIDGIRHAIMQDAMQLPVQYQAAGIVLADNMERLAIQHNRQLAARPPRANINLSGERKLPTQTIQTEEPVRAGPLPPAPVEEAAPQETKPKAETEASKKRAASAATREAAQKAVDEGKLKELSDDDLNKYVQATKRLTIVNKALRAELERRQATKSGAPRQRLKKALKKEGEGRQVVGDAIVTPIKEDATDFSDKRLYPDPPKNKFSGEKGTATVLENAPVENARFVTQDETLEVSWAEGGKISMPANTYYVYDGTPVRRDIYERTREPVDGSKFGQDGKFRKKAGVEFKIVKANKAGNIKTLEAPKEGQNYKEGDLIFTGVAGENWNQAEAKAAKTYSIEFERKPHAVPEQGAEPVSPREGAEASEEVGPGTPEPEEPTRESEAKEEVDTPEERLYLEVSALSNPAQRVRAALKAWGKSYKFHAEWLDPIKQLTRGEQHRVLKAVLARVEIDELTKGVSEKKSKRFLDDMTAAARQFVKSPKDFEAFVRANIKDAAAWVSDSASDPFPSAKRRALDILAEYGNQRMVKQDKFRLGRYEKLWELIKAIPVGTRGASVLPANWKQIVVENSEGVFRSEREVTQNLKALFDSYRSTAGREAKNYGPLIRRLKADERPKRMAENEEEEKREGQPPLSKMDVLKTITSVQKRVDKELRFRTVHVFDSWQDFLTRTRTETFVTEDGHGITVFDYIMLQVRSMQAASAEFKAKSEKEQLQHYFSHSFYNANALVIPAFDALVVFSNKVDSHDHLITILEHEWVGHKGLRAIFENQQEVNRFLTRLGHIPGMDKMRIEFLKNRPGYNVETRLSQLEELLVFHVESGPSALEKLLSAPEGIDQKTRRTLWQDLLQAIKDWINKIFGVEPTQDAALAALNEISKALKQYALVGEVTNLTHIVDKYIGDEKTYDPMVFDPTDMQRMAVEAGTPAMDTIERLFGTSIGNAGRPYVAQSWGEQMGATVAGSGSVLEKARDILNNNFGTSPKEAWRKVGRNLETTDNMAMRSTLIEKVLDIMRRTIATARMLMTKRAETRTYALKSAEMGWWRRLFGDKDVGSTEAQRKAYNKMAIIATNGRMAQATDELVRAAPRLLQRLPNGTFTVNRTAFTRLLREYTYSKKDFVNGIEQLYLGEGNEVLSAGVQKLTAEEVELGYDIYEAETKNLAESALETLEHAAMMLSQMNEVVVARLIQETRLEGADAVFLDEALSRMFVLYTKVAFHNYSSNGRIERINQRNMARDLIIEMQRTLHNEEKVKDWTDATRERVGDKLREHDAFDWRTLNEKTAPFWTDLEWFITPDTAGQTVFHRMNGLGLNEDMQYRMLGAFQNLLNEELQATEHENDVIQSIMGNYVEFTRKGEWRVFLEAIDVKTGKRAELTADFLGAMPVSYPKSKREAIELQKTFAEDEFAGEYDAVDKLDRPIKIRFAVGIEKAPVTRTLAEPPNIKKFLEVADVLDMKLSAPQMRKIANMIESGQTRKRVGLQRQGYPGMDEDILGNNNDLLTRRAWWAAKMSQAWDLENVMADNRNIFGDWHKLERLQRNFDIANRGAPEGKPVPAGFVRNQAAVALAEQALLRYAWQMKHMAQSTTARDHVVIRTTKGERKLKIEGEGRAYQAHAVALQESLERNELDVNLNDLLSKTGPLRLMAVVAQLGTIAAGIMNAFATITHLPFVLMAKHSDTGYGEGFQFGDVTTGLMQSLKDVGLDFRMVESKYVKGLLDKARAGQNPTNLTLPELEALYEEILEGQLQPNQTYSFTGGTESRLRSIWLRNVIEAIMAPFSNIEAANRRIAFLTSYRLMKAQRIAAGVSEAKLNDTNSVEYKELIDSVNRVIFQTQGDYTNVNRPKAGRGDLAQYVFMYKLFQIMTTQMIYNLPRAQQGAVLGVFFLLAGLKGEPFADDFMDLYDTLLQKLGFKHDSAELQLTQFFENVMPGSSQYIMRGFLDPLAFGGTMSSRISMGDMIPLTGAFREGADWGRELDAALGPAWSANRGAVEWAWVLTQYTMQTMGLGDKTLSFASVIRHTPFAGARAAGEAYMMAADGQITDRDGRLISDEVTAGTIFTRALGFYPIEATRANDAVRLDRFHNGYMRAVRARYILSWANHYRTNDREGMRRVEAYVKDWNDWAREANREDMLITNFRSAAQRAGEAAASTTIERAEEGAADFSLVDRLAEIMNADTESE